MLWYMNACSGHDQKPMETIMKEEQELLRRYVLACNRLRSCKSEAKGFVSGMRQYNLRKAENDYKFALAALADYTERKAREDLGDDPQPAPLREE